MSCTSPSLRVFRPGFVLALATLTTAAASLPAGEAPPGLSVQVRSYPEPGQLLASVLVPQIPGSTAGGELRLSVQLQSAAGDDLGRREYDTAAGMREEVVLDAAELPPGDYSVVVELTAPDGSRLDRQTQTAGWPGRAAAFKNIRVLNNFVWELLDVQAAPDEPLAGEYTVQLPYDRWLFVRSTADASAGGRAEVRLRLGEEDVPLTLHERGAPAVVEGMRFAQAGRHIVRVTVDGPVALKRLEVRAVPEIQHSRYPASVMHVNQGVQYDWEFLGQHILPHVNTIITSGPPESAVPHLRQWKARGGKVIAYSGRPGLQGKKQLEATPEICADYWSQRSGYAHPLLDGALVDEFYHDEDPAYPTYTAAVERLNSQFPDRAFYPYAAGRFGKDQGSVPFAAECIAGGGYVCWEAYLAEWATAEQALNALRGYPHTHLIPFEEKLPGLVRNTIWVFGAFSFPWPYADGYASVDYNAYLDMQFQFIATHPALFGLGGVHIWRSGYCDEERVRWFGRFFRHYAIEGRTERLSGNPYLLEHIQNPDFARGLDGWSLEPAAQGSIAAGQEKGFGKFIGRYYRGPDTFLVTARQADKPNRIRQEVQRLEPGKLYSVKLFTGDYGDWQEGKSARQLHPVALEIAGAELLSEPRHRYQQAFPTRQNLGRFTSARPFWLNYHWQVFRAQQPTATLSISDWQSTEDAGGPPGQQLLYTFVEVKPYLEDDARAK